MAKPAGSACNLDCAYCFYLSKRVLPGGPGSGHMPDEVLERFVKDYIDSITVRIEGLKHDLVAVDGPFEGTFNINENSGVVSLPDLMPLADDSTGGIGIYRDNPDAGIPGGFDSMDIPVELRNDFLQYKRIGTNLVEVTLKPTDGLGLPPEDFSIDNI